MSDTKIEWATKVWNPVTGCTKISPGCKNCYAERMAPRLRGRFGYPADDPFRVMLHPNRLEEPLHWRKPQRVFVCSMGDLFHEDVDLESISRVFQTIRSCNGQKVISWPGTKQRKVTKHIFLLLTKRPERLKDLWHYWGGTFKESPHFMPKNVWLGVTAENQEHADKRIPILLQIPAAVRFVSMEPMLGPVDLNRWMQTNHNGEVKIPGCPHDYRVSYKPRCLDPEHYLPSLSWIICGGESGPGARPMHPGWARSLRDQCVEAGVPFFFKQWGAWFPVTSIYKQPNAAEYDMQGKDLDDFDYQWSTGRGIKALDISGNFRSPDYKRREKPYHEERALKEWWFVKVGKKAAGRELDGRVWDQFPEVSE